MQVWVFTESRNGTPERSAFELLAKAREIGEPIVFSAGVPDDDAVAALGDHGATAIHVLDPGDALPAAAATVALAERVDDAALVLFTQGNTSRDVAGRLSARMGRPVVANALDVRITEDGPVVTTEILGGTRRVLTRVTTPAPALVLVRPKAFAAEPVGGPPPAVSPMEAPEVGRAGSARITGRHEEPSEGPDLEAADVVVSGGRGMGDAERFQTLYELAGLLGGAVGATRAVVDAGWVPYSLQVGQTGKVVKPTVYLAAGISGAMQHLVGMKDSSIIIAINKDPDAPIFSVADLGVVGDVHQVLPKLVAALRERT